MKKRAALLSLFLCVAAAAQDAAPTPPLDSDLVSRPLFSQSRRPSAAPAAATLSSASMRLSGLVVDRNGKTVALIHLAERNGEVRVGPGATVNGWQVASIDGRGIELLSGRQQARIGLKQMIPPAPE